MDSEPSMNNLSDSGVISTVITNLSYDNDNDNNASDVASATFIYITTITVELTLNIVIIEASETHDNPDMNYYTTPASSSEEWDTNSDGIEDGSSDDLEESSI